MLKPEVISVVGGHWGDEGKGKIIDLLAENADMVIRPGGGDNAGHTVKNHVGEFALHLISSGIFNPDVVNVLGNNMALNPERFLDEEADLRSRGVSTENIVISPRAQLTLAYHQWLDGNQEQARGDQAIDTTKRGIGPTYMDKAERSGLRVGLLKEKPAYVMDILAKLLKQKAALYFPNAVTVPDVFKPEYYQTLIEKACREIGPRIVDTDALTNRYLDQGKRILLEGAQGTLLDNTYGTYPNVTSSGCTVMSLMEGAKIPPQYFTRSFGVFKIPPSRVGNGGMPTEIFGKLADSLREKGHEYGATTGRPRRLGWPDGVAMRHSQAINRFTDVALVKGDMLTRLRDLWVCNEYLRRGHIVSKFPVEDRILQECTPRYIAERDKFRGWDEDFTGATEIDELPEEFCNYLDKGLMSNLPGARLAYIGTGPGRNDGVKLAL